ncbi:Fcf2 pre-rRNA processing-domain-containing protein [Lipomyces chichibuensis]|uniref:Fcf2 pre-rRNA processing-domain-containing protein n=1 Tax=Lipomyces chichibuensis TaxID=1546026 RepID=UPI0033436923
MSSASLKNGVERSSGAVTAEEKKIFAVEDQHFHALTDDLEEANSAIEENNENEVLKRLPKLASSIGSLNYLTKGSGVVRLNSRALVSNMQSSKLTFRKIVDPIKIKRENEETKEATAGEKWFHMPKTELTPTIKRDMQLLKLRNVLDPKRHYRRENEREVPKYFQTGTIMEGPTEYFSSRLTKKERKQTLADEILADEKAKTYFKRKYDEIQTVKVSGGKNFYKSIKRKRNRR